MAVLCKNVKLNMDKDFGISHAGLMSVVSSHQEFTVWYNNMMC